MRGFRDSTERFDDITSARSPVNPLSISLRGHLTSLLVLFAMELSTVLKISTPSSFRNLTNLTLILLFIGLASNCSVQSLDVKNFVVFGGSGKTGALIVKRLLSENIEGRKIICPVRNLAKARAILGPESKFLSLLPCDLERDSIDKVVYIVNNADAVVISSAYSPGTLLQRLFSLRYVRKHNC